jgi:hypothetical protein
LRRGQPSGSSRLQTRSLQDRAGQPDEDG